MRVEVTVDGVARQFDANVTVAAALWNAGILVTRTSVSGQARAPLCGMGVCEECRVTVDGVAHRRACMTAVRAGMVVSTVDRRAP
jgi:predicted molibdopterin-dependent oxidoreductase YjgC